MTVFTPVETHVTYSQLAIRPVDGFTGLPPRSEVNVRLEFEDATPAWQPTNRKPIKSLSGNLLFPGLGRSADRAAAPITHYRVFVESEFYRPLYLRTLDAIEFDVHPYDDDNAPAVVPPVPQVVTLTPAANYPFESFVRVVRGRTIDGVTLLPVANAEVFFGAGVDQVITDERGVFALPLRWPPLVGSITIDAVDHRNGVASSANINLPAALTQPLMIAF
ncbi:MAG: hypothetical protein ACR2RL_08440 [Gammaproteobacteria bacterium]